MSHTDLGIAEGSSQYICISFEEQQQYQFLYNQEIRQDASSQTELVMQLSHQFDELNLTPVAETLQQRQSQESQTGTIEKFDETISVREIEDLMQTKKKPFATETASTYLESSISSLHLVQLVRITTFNLCYKIQMIDDFFTSLQHQTPTNSLVVESTPACCTELVGLTLNTTREYDNTQSILLF
jgi:hypothetical protein